MDADHKVDWRKKQYYIPHYYLDSGDTCVWKDAEGNLIFRQVIKDGGLVFIRPAGSGAWARTRNQPEAEPCGFYKGDGTVARQPPF